MSKNLSIIPANDQAALESQLTRWRQAEEGFEHCTLLARVMQGLCLTDLRKLHGSEKGGRPKTSESFGGFSPWSDYIKSKWGFTDDTARARIQLAEAAKPRLKKLAENAQKGLGAILDKPFSQLSEGEFDSLKSVTHKLTDGKTNRMLQEELGLFKGDAGKKKGGARDKSGAGKGITPEQEAAESYQSIVQALDGFFAENFHTLLTPDQRKQFAAVLSEARRKTDAVK